MVEIGEWANDYYCSIKQQWVSSVSNYCNNYANKMHQNIVLCISISENRIWRKIEMEDCFVQSIVFPCCRYLKSCFIEQYFGLFGRFPIKSSLFRYTFLKSQLNSYIFGPEWIQHSCGLYYICQFWALHIT